MSRKSFIQSVGATCDNWNWSWSFVNHAERFVIFGLWDIHADGMILRSTWIGKGRQQSLEHIRLIEEEGYQLKTFAMEYSISNEGKTKIKSFERQLIDKVLLYRAGNWYALDDGAQPEMPIPEEVTDKSGLLEGTTKEITVNVYERNPKARDACVEHYGFTCFACDFDFEAVYGEIGKEFIHVHHEVPLADVGREYEIDPIKDLKPLCPNCHAIVHRTRRKPMTVGRLKRLLARRRE